MFMRSGGKKYRMKNSDKKITYGDEYYLSYIGIIKNSVKRKVYKYESFYDTY